MELPTFYAHNGATNIFHPRFEKRDFVLVL